MRERPEVNLSQALEMMATGLRLKELASWMCVVVGASLLVGCRCGAVEESPDDGLTVVETLRIGASSVEIYVAYGPDSAVLGFSKDDGRRIGYCPMYGSTYRGLPAVTLELFVSKDQAQMWIQSSWLGQKVLAYHRFETDTCLTSYGEKSFYAAPMPRQLSGGNDAFPPMDPASVTKVRTTKLP